jgi:hypothetical protein
VSVINSSIFANLGLVTSFFGSSFFGSGSGLTSSFSTYSLNLLLNSLILKPLELAIISKILFYNLL